ncbi:MAG: GNAT family N-acetyltransferase [Bacteroidales bacterium]|jgi:ribosomal protein S18 acetylase RimI-like enzyme|nr:GNAT family N-acetyltransferase [Bacteroidales bacterium]
MKIAIHKTGNDYPYRLLLQADETRESINKYLFDSEVYVVRFPQEEEPAGVFCLYRVDESTVELKNIAVDEPYRGMGTGSRLIEEIAVIAAMNGYKEIIVGTGTEDCAPALIRFYERNGFHKSGLRENFFIDNFPEPIYENGVLLKDMQILSRIVE